MSGVEIIGLISAAISIVDAISKLVDTIKDADGLPQAFREVATRLPLVREILQTVSKQIETADPDDEACQSIRSVLEDCKDKAESLESVLQKTMAAPDASRLQRYTKAVKSMGKGNRVETLMKGILEDLQLLAEHQVLKAATEPQAETLAQNVEEMAQVPPSTPDEGNVKNQFNNYDKGVIINTKGNGMVNVNSGHGYQFSGAVGTVNLGKN